MCDRYVSPDTSAMQSLFTDRPLSGLVHVLPRFNVAPKQNVPIILNERDGRTSLTMAQWGLIPATWEKHAQPPHNTHFMKSEILTNNTWKQIATSFRCLIPARGWYEWEGKRVVTNRGYLANQPYYHHSSTDAVMAFAGIWSLWERNSGPPVLSCAILTRSAAPSILHVHHRMPVILDAKYFDAWLDSSTPIEVVKALTVASRHDVQCHPVNKHVNIEWNDYPELIQPMDQSPASDKHKPADGGFRAG